MDELNGNVVEAVSENAVEVINNSQSYGKTIVKNGVVIGVLGLAAYGTYEVGKKVVKFVGGLINKAKAKKASKEDNNETVSDEELNEN